MSREQFIRTPLKGNVGNMLFIYLSLLKLGRLLNINTFANLTMPLFGLDFPDISTEGKRAVYTGALMDGLTAGLLPFEALAKLNAASLIECFEVQGYCQNVGNLIPKHDVDYAALLPSPDLGQQIGGRDDELIISIRGGEILMAPHPAYTLLPYDFYDHLISTSGLKPVFYGQIGDNIYISELRRRFPDAQFRVGMGEAYDFQFLRNSKNIVLSISTFSWMAAWLSDAQRIVIPVSALFNPNQNRWGNFLPTDDARYEFYLFPANHALVVDQFAVSNNAMEGRWRWISAANAAAIFSAPPRYPRKLDRYLAALNLDDYVRMNQEILPGREAHGDGYVFRHYLEHGYREGRAPALWIVDGIAAPIPRRLSRLGKTTFSMRSTTLSRSVGKWDIDRHRERLALAYNAISGLIPACALPVFGHPRNRSSLGA